MESFAQRANDVAKEAVPEPEIDLSAAVAQIELANNLYLDPHALIGGELAEAIVQRSERLSVPSSVIINGILPAACSLLPLGTEVIANEVTDFRQPPVLWNLSVAFTGSNKSETSDLAVKPLYNLQDKVPEDQERSFFTSTLTMPGLSRTQADQPNNGCLIYPDELSGFIRKLFNDKQNGRGDELSRMLTLYDGRPQKGTFADKSRNFNISRSAFSLLSTIQPSVLLECMGDLNDDSGLWARFNLCEIPMQRRRLPRQRGKIDNLLPTLSDTYDCIRRLEKRSYGLSEDAADLFCDFYEQCEDKRVDPEVKPALQAYAAKQEGRCARIALILHCLQSCSIGRVPAHLISAETMLGAIQVCDFYEQQLKRFYTVALAHQEESIEGDALLVLQFLKEKKGEADARAIARSGRGLRKAGINRVRAASAALVAKSLITETKPDTWTLTTV